MLQILKDMFTSAPAVDFKELVNEGAKIIDVRTPNEYRSGHINSSKNIPLQQLHQKIDKLSKNETYILCCASGSRSGAAKRMMKNAGFENVHNGGGWMRLQGRLHN